MVEDSQTSRPPSPAEMPRRGRSGHYPSCRREAGHSGPCEPNALTVEPTYGLCLHCRSIEVALNEVTGTRDFSNIGESAHYPVGYGCEVCS